MDEKKIDWQQVSTDQWREKTTDKMQIVRLSTYTHAGHYIGKGYSVRVCVKDKWVCVGSWQEKTFNFEDAKAQAVRHFVRFHTIPEPTQHERLELMLEWPREIWPSDWH